MPPKSRTNGKLQPEQQRKPAAGGLYLSLRALEGLKSYAYKPSGYTVLDDLHQPVWNYITNNWLPLWLAPNLITLMGLWALLAAYALGVKYLPEFAGPAPAWLPAVKCVGAGGGCGVWCAGRFCWLIQETAHVRLLCAMEEDTYARSRCDAMAVHLVLMGVACTLQIPQGWFLIASTFCVFGPWLLAHWEEYHTGIMVYGNGYFGVTEANYAVVALHLWGFLMGQQGWLWRPFAALARSSLVQAALPRFAVSLLAQLQLNQQCSCREGNRQMLVQRCSSCAAAAGRAAHAPGRGCKEARQAAACQAAPSRLFHPLCPALPCRLVVLPVCSLAVLTGGQQILRVFRLAGSKQLEHTTLPKREHGHKQLGKAAAAAHIAQLAVFFALGAAMLGLAAPQLPGQARVANATFGILYALQATKLIMAHMAKEPYEVGNHFLPFADAVLLNYSVCAVSLALYLHYVVSMVREICAFLCIPCLTVRKVD
ncbi:hypothetical protein COHA_000282 [Chlorella ohadii]|uniref:Uncharacterized protein n=1 Tax=Chlorella ohadii TaxID=2649997 RepID=A0AAD5DXF1_9CHLO|nr:hypothetical protein COHA_000282 [Chlorella ohadii]